MARRTLVFALTISALAAGRSDLRARQTGQAAPSALVERVADTGFHPAGGRQLRPARRATAGAGLLADAGVDRDRSDHLRPAVALRHQRKAAARGNRGAAVGRAARGVREDSNVRAALLGQPRQSQREHDAQKFLPTFTVDELRAGRLAAQANGGFKTPYADLPALADRGRPDEGARRARTGAFRRHLRADDHGEDAAARTGHPAGQLEHVLSGRDASRISPDVHGAISVQLADRQRARRRASRGGVSGGHAGRQDRAGSLRRVPEEGDRVPREGTRARRSRAGEGDRAL